MTEILVIDDDEIFGQLTVERLEDNYTVAFHRGPFGTISAIRTHDPRLIIMDVNMPGLDGPSVFDLLRKEDSSQDIKLLLMSSLEQRELEEVAARAGIEDALHKSASRSELLAKIRSMLRR